MKDKYNLIIKNILQIQSLRENLYL